MIICSCNVLSDRDLARAAEEIRAEPDGRIVTPGGVFRRLGCRPKCGNCFPMVVRVIHKRGDAQPGTGADCPAADWAALKEAGLAAECPDDRHEGQAKKEPTA